MSRLRKKGVSWRLLLFCCNSIDAVASRFTYIICDKAKNIKYKFYNQDYINIYSSILQITFYTNDYNKKRKVLLFELEFSLYYSIG